jgi:hypothetical protein
MLALLVYSLLCVLVGAGVMFLVLSSWRDF